MKIYSWVYILSTISCLKCMLYPMGRNLIKLYQLKKSRKEENNATNTGFKNEYIVMVKVQIQKYSEMTSFND